MASATNAASAPGLEALRGIVPPILTPLDDDERVDHASLRRLIEHQLAGGAHGIWVTGTTGEFPCLDRAERAAAVATTVEAVDGRVPVVASIGDSSTKLAVAHGRAAVAAGADYVAATPPHYFVNSPDEQLNHYRTIREQVDRPLLVYNIPQNVKVKLEVGTVLTLAREGTIVGIKDSQNDLDWFRQVMVGARQAGVPFRGFLGTRYLIDAGLVAGAHGSIASISNVAPALTVAVYEAAMRGDWAAAARSQEQLAELALRLAAVTALIPALKVALKTLGVIDSARATLPHRRVTAAEEERIRAILAEVGVTPRP